MAAIKLIDSHIRNKPELNRVSINRVYCSACERSVKIASKSVKYCINSHERTEHHIKQLELWKRNRLRQLSLSDCHASQGNLFFQELTEMLLSCNIPLRKINNPKFREFIEKHFHKICPDESTLRKSYIEPIYNQQMMNLRDAFSHSWIYIEIDEAHIQQRKIISVLIGKLNGEEPLSRCLNVIEAHSSVDNVLIQQMVIDSLRLLWPSGIKYSNVRLLVTDQASYMTTASMHMKSLFPKLLHVTCLCHGLSRVCEAMSCHYKLVSRLIVNLSSILGRSNRRRALLEETVDQKVPNLPVATRWGTWVKFAAFVYDCAVAINNFLTAIREEDSPSIEEAMASIRSEATLLELQEISKMRSIVGAIRKLETRGLTIYQQKDIIDAQKRQLLPMFEAKLESSLAKNPDYEAIFECDAQREDCNYLYSPLVSVDVERSFSQFKDILSDKRTGLTEKSFKHYSLVYYNNNNSSLEQ